MHTKQIFLNGPEQYLEPYMFFWIGVILLPVWLFPPLCLLEFGESSSLYFYSIL